MVVEHPSHTNERLLDAVSLAITDLISTDQIEVRSGSELVLCSLNMSIDSSRQHCRQFSCHSSRLRRSGE